MTFVYILQSEVDPTGYKFQSRTIRRRRRLGRFLSKITAKQIRRGVFRSAAEQVESFHGCLDRGDAAPDPFVCTKTAVVVITRERSPRIHQFEEPGAGLGTAVDGC
jgi:hypothetical protein